MDYASIKEELVDIFEDVMDADDVELTDETTANDVEEWDSLSHVRLIIAIERQYGIKFSNAEIEGLKKFGDIITLIQTKAG
ncbi:acyl carrier protein [Fluviibacterium sp. DFM31]|uniref:Acyl carrier protein n=1 Tax=Meridianimarinicoccus marinus TaxID=3231483 RepID=A0ABV3L989_9RHOB